MYIILPTVGKTQLKSSNLYIDISKNHSTVEVGYYSEKKHKRVKLLKQPIESVNVDSLINSLCPKSNEKTLIYIHGLGGDKNLTQKQIPKYFNDSIRGNKCIDRTISFVWHATHFRYPKTWTVGYETGQLLAPFFNKILTNISNTTILCHSMGHRIFEGVASELSKIDTNTVPLINEIIFAAPDLYEDAFNSKLKHLPLYCNAIRVYQNKKDKTLGISKRLHKANRLGISGLVDLTNPLLKQKVTQIECSQTKSNAWWEISDHLYFLSDKMVYNDLKQVLKKGTNNSRLKLIDKSKNLYQL